MYFSNISSTFYTLYIHLGIKTFYIQTSIHLLQRFYSHKTHRMLKEGESSLAIGLPVAVAGRSTKTCKGEFILYQNNIFKGLSIYQSIDGLFFPIEAHKLVFLILFFLSVKISFEFLMFQFFEKRVLNEAHKLVFTILFFSMLKSFLNF